MTNSPFDGLLNTAVLTFTLEGAGFTIDEDGLEVPTSSTVILRAFLQDELKPEGESLVGADSSSVYMEGYCVEPTILPEGIGAGAIAEYSYTPEHGATVTGKFRLARKPPSPFGVVQEIVGDEIQGYLNITPGA